MNTQKTSKNNRKFGKENNITFSSLKRILKAQYNKELDEAEKRVRADKFVTNEQVIKEMKKW
jgi:hypothetical protein